MSTVVMRKIELVALRSDVDGVLECLGHAGCFQISPPSGTARGLAAAPKAEAGRGAGLEALEELGRFLGLDYPDGVEAGARLPGEKESAELEFMRSRAREIGDAVKANADEAAKAREALEEARIFAGLELPYRELDDLSFIVVRIGRAPPEEIKAIREALGERAMILALSKEGDIVAIASRIGRFALDTELARAGFEPRRFPPDFALVPPELPAALERELAELEERRAFLEREREDLAEELSGPWRELASSYAVDASVEEAKLSLETSSQACRLEGWAPRDEVRGLAEALEAKTGGRVALRSYSPREIESVRDGREEVPVLLKRRRFVSSFERMVLSFGTPPYGSVDPTPFVCGSFILLFSIMFGDLGQGLLILAGALAIHHGLVPSLAKWKVFAPIGMACGMGSMIMGFLTGSFFTFENALVPITRALSQALLGRPVDRFLALMPEGSTSKVLVFFGFTLALGVIVNSTGLVINIVDAWRSGRRGAALFSKTGLAGALFFFWAIGMGIRAVFGSRPEWFDALGLGLPMLALILEERLSALADGKAKDGEGRGEGALAAGVKAFVAVLEPVSYFLSNSLSFLRVGAFALSHVVLSYIVFTMGDMLRHRSPAGLALQALVVLFGNAIIVFLEGLIVAIQVVRLQYYEFLSKFLTETGRAFAPFRFRFRKEEP